MWPVFNIDFGSIDDHEILDIIGRRPRLPLSQVLSETASRSNEQIGRFRPVYWAGRALEAALVGRHSDYWFVNRVVLAAITLAAVYSVAKRYVAPPAAAAVSLLPFFGTQFETWRRLGPNETYAVPFLCIGIALLVDGNAKSKSPSKMWLGYVFLTLAGGAKENFLFITIFLIAVSTWKYGIRRLTCVDWLVLGLTLTLWSLDLLFVFCPIPETGRCSSFPNRSKRGPRMAGSPWSRMCTMTTACRCSLEPTNRSVRRAFPRPGDQGAPDLHYGLR